jgi:hypothetical protein
MYVYHFLPFLPAPCVCVCVCVCVCMHVCVYADVNTSCVNTSCVHACSIYTCTYTHTYVYMNTYKHVSWEEKLHHIMHTYIHTYIHTYVSMYVYCNDCISKYIVHVYAYIMAAGLHSLHGSSQIMHTCIPSYSYTHTSWPQDCTAYMALRRLDPNGRIFRWALHLTNCYRSVDPMQALNLRDRRDMRIAESDVREYGHDDGGSDTRQTDRGHARHSVGYTAGGARDDYDHVTVGSQYDHNHAQILQNGGVKSAKGAVANTLKPRTEDTNPMSKHALYAHTEGLHQATSIETSQYRALRTKAVADTARRQDDEYADPEDTPAPTVGDDNMTNGCPIYCPPRSLCNATARACK